MTTAIVIPARYESSRFPGKPLAQIAGKPMIDWVIEAALKSKLANTVIVATDDERIYNHTQKQRSQEKEFSVVMTSTAHKSGSDRIAEVIKNNPEIKCVVNLQGDEPLMPTDYIDKVLEPILNKTAPMASLVTPIKEEELPNPNIVKAYINDNGFAHIFSRTRQATQLKPFRHLGIYAFTRETLLKFTSLPESKLENAEKLEQLRALENGITIKLEVVPNAFPSIDRPEDVKNAEEIITLKK